MAPPKLKNPTNSDIFKKLDMMDGRLVAVEKWKEGIEIGRAAVEEYKKEEQSEREAKQRREVMKQVGYVLGLVGLVLYVYLTSKGVHP